jgi:hypothetical protein
MKTILMKPFLVFVLLIFCLEASSQRLAKFESSQVINSDRIPYTSQPAYYGCVGDTIFLDSININATVFYFYLPDSAIEIGVRAISPVPDLTSPRPGDNTDSLFYECSSTNKGYFDPAIILQRGRLKTSKLSANIFEWITITQNDDSKDLPAQPNLLMRNALLRKQPNTKRKNRKLSPGYYRVVLTNNKSHYIVGTFLLQIGIIEKNKRLMLFNSMEELENSLKANK